MKKIILSIMVLIGSQAWATGTNSQLIPQQEVKLLKLLQQMEPEMVEELLSDAGAKWFLENTNNIDTNTFPKIEEEEYSDLIQPADLDVEDYQDKNAPKFN